MVYLIIGILITFSFFEFALFKRKVNLLTIFSALWIVITFLASLELFDMIHVSEKVYEIVFIGCIGFCIGHFLLMFLLYSKRKNISCEVKNEKINMSFLKTLMIFTFIFYFIISIRVLLLMKSGVSYAVIRSMYQGYYGYSSVFPNDLMKSIDTYVTHAFLYTLIPIILISIFEKKMNYKWVVIGLINIAMYLLCSASRFLLLYVIVELLFCIYYYYKDMLVKHRKKIIKVFVILCITIIAMTYFRTITVSNNNYTIAQNLYAYFTVEFPLMDYWIKVAETNNQYSYGMAFMHGLVGLFSKGIKAIGIDMNWYDSVTNMIVPTEEIFVKVFPWKPYNAFISIFYFFYLDFRELGVFIGMLVFGMICAKVDYNFDKKKSMKSKIIYLLMLQNVFTTFVRWQFFNIKMVMAFVFVILLFIPIKLGREKYYAKE